MEWEGRASLGHSLQLSRHPRRGSSLGWPVHIVLFLSPWAAGGPCEQDVVCTGAAKSSFAVVTVRNPEFIPV